MESRLEIESDVQTFGGVIGVKSISMAHAHISTQPYQLAPPPRVLSDCWKHVRTMRRDVCNMQRVGSLKVF